MPGWRARAAMRKGSGGRPNSSGFPLERTVVKAANAKRGAAATATPLRYSALSTLPEEVRDHVDRGSAVGIDQDRVVPVADPDATGRRIGQPVEARIDPILV